MDERRKGALKKHHQDLRTGLIVGNVLPALRPLLTGVEYSRVRDREGNVARVDELIEVLLTKENGHFERFCGALEKNGYGHWSKALWEDVNLVQAVYHNMDERRKGVLKKYREDLRTGLLVGKILPTLHPFLTDAEYSRIRHREDNVERVDELIDILLTKGNREFEQFCSILEQTGYDHWAKILWEEVNQGSVVICSPAHQPVQYPIIDELADEFALLIASLAEEVHSLSRRRLVGLKACIEEKLKSKQNELTLPSSAEGLMSTASKHWNFLNFEIVQVVVLHLGHQNPELLIRMKAYEKSLREKATNVLAYCEKKRIAPKKPPSCSSMTITMDVDPHSYSIYRILEMKDFLVHRIGVNIALFAGWSRGSIILHFYILAGDKVAAVHQLKEHELQLRDMQVIAIEVDGALVISMLPNRATEVNVDISINTVAECLNSGGKLVNTLVEFGQGVMHVSTQVVQTLGEIKDEIKSICRDSVKAALEVACTFFGKVVEVFYHCQSDSMAAAREGLNCSPPDLQPLHTLLRLLGNALAEAAVIYSEFVSACDAAIHSCKEAAEKCSEHTEAMPTAVKWFHRIVGGAYVAVGATVAAGSLALGPLALAGVPIGGVYMAAGAATIHATFKDIKDHIRSIRGEFKTLHSNACDIHDRVAQVRNRVAQVRTTLESVAVPINSTDFSVGTASINLLQDAMERLNMACINSYSTTSRHRKGMKGNVEEVKAKFT